MIRDRIISAIILFLIFLASYLSKNPTYFLLFSFAASGILFYELAKILKEDYKVNGLLKEGEISIRVAKGRLEQRLSMRSRTPP